MKIMPSTAISACELSARSSSRRAPPLSRSSTITISATTGVASSSPRRTAPAYIWPTPGNRNESRAAMLGEGLAGKAGPIAGGGGLAVYGGSAGEQAPGVISPGRAALAVVARLGRRLGEVLAEDVAYPRPDPGQRGVIYRPWLVRGLEAHLQDCVGI